MSEKTIEEILKEKKIYEIVNPKLVQAPPESSISDAIELMKLNKSGYIVVSKNKKLAGLFTEGDIIQKVLEQDVDWSKPISEFMNLTPPVLSLQDTIGTAIDLMGQLNIYYIPLVDENQELVNIISVRTLINFLAAFYPNEVYNLPPRFDQISATQEGG